ncbi:MAG TPA: hypothetical protein VFD07_07585 [Candidatus Krumholzibacteria bacterium]|nr:hypothetical protein [Candidatus Krumholzibacteria bacterium]
MPRRALLVGLIALSFPGLALAQGRNTKVYYDDAFAFGSKALEQSRTRYFQVLTTPAPEDPDGQMVSYWGPQLDDFFVRVCDNLHLRRDEVYRYLLYPRYFAQIEKLVLEGKLHPAASDSLMQMVIDVGENGASSPPQPFVLVDPRAAPGSLHASPRVQRRQRFRERHVEASGDTLFVWLPEDDARSYQRCVLYRTLHDFLATPIGPTLPEGVLGFVPIHDASLPIVIYASLGEQRLRRTAQHEIAHAVVESIARYLRQMTPTRNRTAQRDSGCTKGWRPGSGGFSMVTHENYAEYLAFPHGQMEPALRAALIELVAENQIDGLAAMSVGARTQASAYIEGPARLVFLAQSFGPEIPKNLLIKYHTNSCGFLDWLEEMTGHGLPALEQLYRRWLRETLWAEYLSTSIPDTIGTVLAQTLSGVQRGDRLLLQRVRRSRQEAVLRQVVPEGEGEEKLLARDLQGIERLPLFSSPDLRHGRVVAVARHRNRETLLLWDEVGQKRMRTLHELGAVREVRDPRWSPSGSHIVFRVVDRAGRNAIGALDVERDVAHFLVPYRWAELNHPSFASDSLVLFTSTATSSGRSDVFELELTSGVVCNLTQSAEISESEPLRINGRLVYLSDAASVPRPVEQIEIGHVRELLDLPFPVSGMQQSDSLLTLVATSVRHHLAPGGRALWGFPLRKLGLDVAAPAVIAVTNPEEMIPNEPHAADATIAAALPSQASAPATDQTAAAPNAPTLVTASTSLLDPVAIASPPVIGLGSDVRGTGEQAALGVKVSPYKQKWRLMPFGVSLSSASTRTRGATYVGMDTEFHDQAALVAVGQNGDFDRFGIVQYRNMASRTHWNVGAYYRSLLRSYYDTGITRTYHRNQSESGGLFSAQYHQSLVTRWGAALSVTQRTDTRGLYFRAEDITLKEPEAPVAAFRAPGLDPRSWNLSCGGVGDPAMLLDRSPAGIERWAETEKLAARDAEMIFQPTETYVRPNAEIGVSYSRDTRVWSDTRGPRTGSLFVATLSSGFNAWGTRNFFDAAENDSLSLDMPPGLDRMSLNLLFLTHRRVAFFDVALRARAYLNDGPQSLVYGVGGLYSVAGFPQGFLRGEQVAYSNLEVRAPFWDYSRFRMPVWSPVLPAAEGFFYADAGIATHSRNIYSYGVGLRLRYGMLSFEWRQPLRSGLANQNGFTAAW